MLAKKCTPARGSPLSQPPRPNGKIIPAQREGGGNIINYQMRSFITIRGGGHTRPRKIRANFLKITILCHRSSHLFCSRHFYHHLCSSRGQRGRGGRRKKKSCADAALLIFLQRPDCISESLINKCLTNTSRPILIPSLPFFQSTDAAPGIFPLRRVSIYFIDIRSRKGLTSASVVFWCAFLFYKFYYLPLDGWILSSRRLYEAQ
jgi:hypothetical protein